MLRIKSDYDLRSTIKTLCRACQSNSEIPIQPFHQRKFMEIIKASQEISFSGLLWAKCSPALRSNTRFRIFSLFSHNLNMSIVYLISARLYLTNFSRWHVCYAYLPFPKIMARKTHKIERKYNKMVMITRKTNDSNDNDRNEKEEAHRNKKKSVHAERENVIWIEQVVLFGSQISIFVGDDSFLLLLLVWLWWSWPLSLLQLIFIN